MPMSERKIVPWSGPPPKATVRVPGSKSLTNRALIIAALAEGKSTILGALESDDTKVMVDSLQKLGFGIEHDRENATIRVEGTRGEIPRDEADLFVAGSGTSLRFLTALTSIGKGKYRIDGNARMRERPVADLLLPLNRLGAIAKSELGNGCPPVTIDADGLHGDIVSVRGDISSQFLSALLMSLPYAKENSSVEVEGTLVSKPYISMTLSVMEAFGVTISNRSFQRFNIRPASYSGRTYSIEPDASAASYFFAIAAVLGGSITIDGLGTKSAQGDLAFVDILEHMGCAVERKQNSTTVIGGNLRGADVDMNAISDTVMTLGVVALFADGPTRIRNVAHIRHKETDRVSALSTELRKLGATVDERADGLVVFPPARISPAKISTYDDHRMAMSFAIAGLKSPGVVILDPGCVSKTYPGFWTDLERLRAESAEDETTSL